jgi:hypothetical protein
MLPLWGWGADRARGKIGLFSNWPTTDLQAEIDQIRETSPIESTEDG